VHGGCKSIFCPSCDMTPKSSLPSKDQPSAFTVPYSQHMGELRHESLAHESLGSRPKVTASWVGRRPYGFGWTHTGPRWMALHGAPTRQTSSASANGFSRMLADLVSDVAKIQVGLQNLEQQHREEFNKMMSYGTYHVPSTEQCPGTPDHLGGISGILESHDASEASAHASDNLSDGEGSRPRVCSPEIDLHTRTMCLDLRTCWDEAKEETINSHSKLIRSCRQAHFKDMTTAALQKTRLHSVVSERASIVKDRQRNHCVLHPHGNARICWNVLCLLGIAFDVVMVPLETFDIPESRAFFVTEVLLAILWTVDMFLSMKTGFFAGSTLVTSTSRIILNYIKTWMSIDLCIVIMEWVTIATNQNNGAAVARGTRTFRLLRTVRLLRFLKIRALWAAVEDHINSHLVSLGFSIVKLSIALLIMVHAISCGWYALGKDARGWINDYQYPRDERPDWVFWYFASMRWSLAQINGRTDMKENRTNDELMYTCAVAIVFAVIFMSIFVSSITATLLEFTSAASAKMKNRRDMEEFFSGHFLSEETLLAMKLHLRAKEEYEDEIVKEGQLLDLLPSGLAREVLYEVRGPLVTQHPLLADLNSEFSQVMRHLCGEAMSMIAAHDLEVVFEQGESSNRMLFVDKGKLEYVSRAGAEGTTLHVSTLLPRFWVSEAALWLFWITQGQLTANEYSTLVAIDAAGFAQVLSEYREAYLCACRYARWYVGGLSEQPVVTDMLTWAHSATADL